MTSLTYGSATRGSAARSQRAVLFGTIAGLHALVIALIVSGFGRVAMESILPEMKATVLPPVAESPRPTPPPQDPVLRHAWVEKVPTPVVHFQVDDDVGPTITVPFDDTKPPPPIIETRPVPPPIHLVGKHRLPNSDDYYPLDKIREGAEGASTVGVCIDANGKRNSEPKVVESSGDASFDSGAMRLLRDGRYARAMQGDQYVANCYQFRIVFKLKTR